MNAVRKPWRYTNLAAVLHWSEVMGAAGERVHLGTTPGETKPRYRVSVYLRVWAMDVRDPDGLRWVRLRGVQTVRRWSTADAAMTAAAKMEVDRVSENR